MNVYVLSLGCSKNTVDTELMLGILSDAGYTPVQEPSQADIIIVNTCGFIEAAKQQSIDSILALSAYKEDRCRVLAVTGCLGQRYAEDLLDGMPETDLLLGVNQYPMLPRAIAQALMGKRPCYIEDAGGVLSGRRVLTTPPYLAYVRIADGCDNRCAYCAIPLIRGGFRSRPMADILDEIRTLTAQGVSEITLVAQDTSRYGIDFDGVSHLPELLTAAADIPGVHWLRVLYLYPDEVDGRLLDAMESRENIVKYLDLPLQHADAGLLRAMNRRGDTAFTERLLTEARARGFTLRTTFIVGFPGETEEQFQTLLDFTERIGFDRMGAFAFSPEEDTPAYDLPEQIDEEVKQSRLDELMGLQQGISLEHNQARVGSSVEVLVEKANASGRGAGRSRMEAPEEADGIIALRGVCPADVGHYLTARITAADVYDLEAEIIR